MSSSQLNNQVFLGLGGNLGDVQNSMVTALNWINAQPSCEVIRLSSLYRTPPWGVINQPDFLNCCVEIKTSLQPLQLLDLVKGMEKQLKRKKTRKWGPRTLDIDLLLWQGQIVNESRLTLPHPRIGERSFVVIPLYEIAPEAVDAAISKADRDLRLSDKSIHIVEKGAGWWLTLNT